MDACIFLEKWNMTVALRIPPPPSFSAGAEPPGCLAAQRLPSVSCQEGGAERTQPPRCLLGGGGGEGGVPGRHFCLRPMLPELPVSHAVLPAHAPQEAAAYQGAGPILSRLCVILRFTEGAA